MSKRQPALGFAFVTLFLDIVGIGLVAPIVPKLIEKFVGGDVGEAAQFGGWITAIYAVMQFIFAPILGNLSDQLRASPDHSDFPARLGARLLAAGFRA